MAFQLPQSFEEQQNLFSQIQQSGQVNNTNFQTLADLQSRIGSETDEAYRQRLQGEFSNLFNKEITQNINPELDKARSKISDELTAFANKTDFSTLSGEQAAKEMGVLQSERDRVSSLQQQIDFLNAFGQDTTDLQQQIQSLQTRLDTPAEQLAGTQFTPSGTVRTEQGFTSQAEADQMAQQAGAPAGAEGRTAPSTIVRKNAQGTFDIVDPQTGNVLEGGIEDQTLALNRQNELQAGAGSEISGLGSVGTIQEQKALLDEAERLGVSADRLQQAKTNAQQQGASLSPGDRLLNPDDFDRLRTQFGATPENFDQ